MINGIKTIDTRTWKLPNYKIGKRIAIIETPGPLKGKFKIK